jgi:NADP-dependent 3-hydroxy acid dehydrogenase YdfG
MVISDAKVILIAGAGSAHGRACARYLAANGMRVVLGERRTERLVGLAAEIRARGGVAEVAQLDVACPDSLRDFVDFALDCHGRVDALLSPSGFKQEYPALWQPPAAHGSARALPSHGRSP